MKDRTLLALALAISIIGVIVLFIISRSIDIPEPNLLELQSMDDGSTVTVRGRVTSVRAMDNMVIFDLDVEDHLPIVIFDAVEVAEGEYLSVTGELRDYEGKKELIADSLQR